MDDYDPAALARRLAAEHAGDNANAEINSAEVGAQSVPGQVSDEPSAKADVGAAQGPTLIRRNPSAPTIAELRTESSAHNQLVFSSAATFSETRMTRGEQANEVTPSAQTQPQAGVQVSAQAQTRTQTQTWTTQTQAPAETQPAPKQKPSRPKKPLNLRILLPCAGVGVLIAGFWLYFAYFYYWSDSFTGTTQVAQLETKKNPSQTAAQTADQGETKASGGQNAGSTPAGGFTTLSLASEKGKYFSKLSGEELNDLRENAAPTFCVQIPNGVDGGRPQVGLAEAKVVFEAITEAGITRFAAIYQNELPSVIGPIRSLRTYYLYWDTPFDCIVVHAGGADDALSALRANNYRELDEDRDYMFRDTNAAERLWNNLFATQTGLSSFAQNMGYLSSDIQAFAHYTPVSGAIAKIKTQATHPLVIDQAADGDTSELKPRITKIDLHFGEMPNFNPVFSYDVVSNSYLRAYETGEAHLALNCSGLEGREQPSLVELSCAEQQVTAQSVIAMIVRESRAADNYHENIAALGTGAAYVFQNGGMIEGTWEKNEIGEQIVFRDKQGQEIKLVPGRTWIAAIPTYGSVEYE